MEFDFLKKWAYFVLAVAGLGWYVSNHYTFKDVLQYSRAHPNPDWSPRLDYYSAMAYYVRDRNADAADAFNQLLTDYPTCQYAASAMKDLGQAYIGMNNYQGARDILSRYFEEYPDDRDRKTVQEQYEYIKFR